MAKFEVGEKVMIKTGHSMSSLVGVIVKHFKENHTYLVKFSRDLKLILAEADLISVPKV